MTADALHFAEDIRWHVSGRAPFAGDFEGMGQVLGSIYGPIFELSGGTFRAELHDVLANDEQAVALYTSRAKRAGKHIEGNFINVTHIRDGKITEI
jgi:ketosteroid isomerase-like protein